MTRNTAASNQEDQEPLENDQPSVYVNAVEYDDFLEPVSSSPDPLCGPAGLDNPAVCSGITIPETSGQSNYQQHQDTAYQEIVLKGGSLLPDIKVGDLGRYIISVLEKDHALVEEFKVKKTKFLN